MIRPTEGRVVLKITKRLSKNESGEETYEPEQVAKVMSSGSKQFKRGDKVIPVIASWVPVHSTETKKDFQVIIDAEDIMGYAE